METKKIELEIPVGKKAIWVNDVLTLVDDKPQDVTERIKTFEDACKELGEDHPLVRVWNTFRMSYNPWGEYEDIADLAAYFKLRIITAALNEGWQPKFTESEWRWYPRFYLYTEAELVEMDDEWKQGHTVIATGDYDTEYAYSYNAPSHPDANFGSRLCYKSEALAVYSGWQFGDLWADFILIRKNITDSIEPLDPTKGETKL